MTMDILKTWMRPAQGCKQFTTAATLLLLLFAGTASAAVTVPKLQPLPRHLQVNKDPVCTSFFQFATQQYQSNVGIDFYASERVEPALEADLELAPFDTSKQVRVKFLWRHPEIAGWQWLEWLPVPYIAHFFNEYNVSRSLLRPELPEPFASQLLLEFDRYNYLQADLNYLWVPAEEVAKVAQHPQQYDQLLPGANNESAAWAPYLLSAISGSQSDVNGRLQQGLNLFRFQQNVYQLRPDWTVYKVSEKPELVCQLAKVDIPELPLLKSFYRLVQQSFITQGDYIEQGSLGYPERAIDAPFYDLLTRPWRILMEGPLVFVDAQQHCAKDAPCLDEDDIEHWFRYFGEQDAWSARELLNLRQHLQLATTEVAGFYQQRFSLTAEQAKRLSQRAVLLYVSQVIGKTQVPDEPADPGLTPERADYVLDQWSVLSNAQQQQLLSARNRFGKNALMLAAHLNDLDALQALLPTNISLYEQTAHSGQYGSGLMKSRTALIYAAENASPEVIDLLLKAGAATVMSDEIRQATTQALSKNRTLQLMQLSELSLEQIVQRATDLVPAFACDKVSRPHEKMLCSSAGLRLYDREMSLRYKALQKTAIATQLKQDQRRWLKELWQLCTQPNALDQLSCYKQQYRGRLRFFDYVLESAQPEVWKVPLRAY